MPVIQLNIDSSSGSLDSAIRALLTEIIRDSPKKRAQIAEEMSLLLQLRISSHMIDCFTSSCKGQHRFPAAWIEAFCTVTNDSRLQRLVMGAQFRKLVDYSERELKAAKEERERSALREELLASK